MGEQTTLLQLMGKSWAELEILEHDGYLLFPDQLMRRQADGSFKARPILLRVPRPHEKRQARVESRARALQAGLDLDRDADLVDDLENMHLLSNAVRNNTSPYEPLEPDVPTFEKMFDHASLNRTWARLQALHRLLDPRPDEISEGEMLALLSKIAKERSIAPLVVYGLDAQERFVISMVERLKSYMESRSSSE